MESNRKPLFIYLRSQSTTLKDKDGNDKRMRGMPLACIAYTVDREKGSIHYGLSTHNPADHFDRAIGRRVAEARFNKRPMSFHYAYGNDPKARDMNVTDIFISLARYFQISPDRKMLPTKVVNAFADFLKEAKRAKAIGKATELLNTLATEEKVEERRVA